MSCGQIALKELGVKVDNYFAAEIDKYAIQVTKHNFPNTIHVGDVTKVSSSDLPKIDLLMGGSPCQGFSFAGKQLAFNDPRSKLFFEFVRLKEELNPKYFLLENVRMAKEHENVITRFMGVEPIYINSALLSAQSRPRVYWTNINAHPSGLFGDLKCLIPQPKDKGVLLRDILETDVPEKYYLSDKMLNYFSKRAASIGDSKNNIEPVCIDTNGKESSEKTGALVASYNKGPDNYSSRPFIKITTNLNVAKNQDKANCFTAGGNSGGLHSDMNLIADSACLAYTRSEEAKRLRRQGIDNFKHKQLEPRLDGKTNCLTSVQKDNLVMQLNPSLESGGKQPFQQNRIYDINGISSALLAQLPGGGHKILIPEATKKGYAEIKPGECFDMTMPTSETRRGRSMENKSNCLTATKFDFMQYTQDFKIRRLTPTECKRLQTVPDWYDMSVVSDTQQYKMLGNGWTIEVIKYILNFAQ